MLVGDRAQQSSKLVPRDPAVGGEELESAVFIEEAEPARDAEQGGCATPGPSLGRWRQAGPDRVVRHVHDGRDQLPVAFDQNRSIATTEDMAAFRAALILGPGKASEEIPHPVRHVCPWGSQDEMKVVAHEAIRVAVPLVTSNDGGQARQELVAILRGIKDRPSVVSARHDVVNAVRDGGTRIPTHETPFAGRMRSWQGASAMKPHGRRTACAFKVTCLRIAGVWHQPSVRQPDNPPDPPDRTLLGCVNTC